MPSSPNIWIASSDGDIVAVGQFLARDPAAVNSHDEYGCKQNIYPQSLHFLLPKRERSIMRVIAIVLKFPMGGGKGEGK